MSASPRSPGVSVTAIEAVYVPADDFTDPAVTAISSHLDSMIVLSRSMAAEGMYPAVDPLSSSSILLDPTVVGEEHYRIAEEVRERSPATRSCRTSSRFLESMSSSAQDRSIVIRARLLLRFLDAALRGHRSLYRHARAIRCAAGDAQRLPHNTRRRLRPLGGEFALHGRHDRRGTRARKLSRSAKQSSA